MKLFIGADHRGYTFKKRIIKIVEELGYEITDMGVGKDVDSFDYPKIAKKVAEKTVKTKDGRGILLCMSGIGQTIAANKVRGALAALCYNSTAAKLSRAHNNSNILVLSTKFIKKDDLKKIIKVWLETPFDGGRHQRRVKQIGRIEQGLKL